MTPKLQCQMLWSTQLGYLIVSWDASMGVIKQGDPFNVMLMEKFSSFLKGFDSRIGTLTIPSGHSV